MNVYIKEGFDYIPLWDKNREKKDKPDSPPKTQKSSGNFPEFI